MDANIRLLVCRITLCNCTTFHVCYREEVSKHLPKPNLYQKKGHAQGFGGLLPIWSTTAFWILMKPLYLSSTLSKWMRCTRTSTPTASIGQQKGLSFSPRQHLTTCHTTNPSKVEWSGLEALPHSPPSPDLSPTDYHFFKHLDSFSEGKCFHRQRDAENAFQEITESRSMGFYATGVNKLISCWQKCVDWNGSYFD